MRRVAREAARALGADMVGAYLTAEDGAELRPIAGYRVPRDLLASFLEHPITLRRTPALEALWASRRAAFSNDPATDPRLSQEVLGRWPFRSILFSPMIVNDEPVGALIAVWWTEAHVFTDDEVRLAEGIGRQAALAIETRRASEGVQRAHAQTEQVLASISWILVAVDADGRVTQWNEAAREALGLPPEGALGRRLADLDVPWRGDPVVEQLAAGATTAPTRLDDIGYHRPDGSEGFLSITLSPLRPEAGRPAGLLLLGTDVTDRRLLEAQHLER
jgi:PAS domain S-box-containing protein